MMRPAALVGDLFTVTVMGWNKWHTVFFNDDADIVGIEGGGPMKQSQ